MHCAWVQDRLVALSDGELSPGEATRVMEHLDDCEECALLDLQLREITPEPHLDVPPEVMANLARVVDAAVQEALDEPVYAPPPTMATRWSRWLRRDRDVSNGQILAAAIVFAMLGGWGLSNWLAAQDGVTMSSPIANVAPSSSSTIDGAQYEPASYRPEEEGENWR